MKKPRGRAARLLRIGSGVSAAHPAARLVRQMKNDLLRRRLAAFAGNGPPERLGGGTGVVLSSGDRGANVLAHGVYGRSLALGDLSERIFGDAKFFAVHPSSSCRLGYA